MCCFQDKNFSLALPLAFIFSVFRHIWRGLVSTLSGLFLIWDKGMKKGKKKKVNSLYYIFCKEILGLECCD